MSIIEWAQTFMCNARHAGLLQLDWAFAMARRSAITVYKTSYATMGFPHSGGSLPSSRLGLSQPFLYFICTQGP
jgi:hypothetical protein